MLPSKAEMMLGYLQHLKPLFKKLEGIEPSQISSSKGLGKALCNACKNTERRVGDSTKKEGNTAERVSLQDESGAISSEPEVADS